MVQQRPPMDQQPAEPGWWIASDGKWYPPESAPGYEPPPAPYTPDPVAAAAAPAPAGTGNGFAVAALVIGILGVLAGLVPLLFFVAGPFGLFALAFGLVGRSRAKKLSLRTGQATAGTILGGVAMVLSVVGFVILVVVIGTTAKKIEQIVNADPAKYQVVISQCGVDSTVNGPSASGTLTNTTGSGKSFIISISFDDSGGTRIGTGTDFVNDVAPGQRATWSVNTSSSGTPSRCSVSSLIAS